MNAGPGLALPPGELRDRHQALILDDLLGPARGEYEEVVGGRVSERYLLGMLAPQRRAVEDAASEDQLALTGAQDGEEGAPEPAAPAIEQLTPSSFGLTFAVESGVERIEVTASWGAYLRAVSEKLQTEAGNPEQVWRREPAGGKLELELSPRVIDPVAVDPERPDVVVRGRIRDRDGERLVTLFLVNEQEEPERLKDEAWLFQAELRVREPNGAPVFIRRGQARSLDPEDRRLDMLYRNQVEFASGHGVGVHSDLSPDDPNRAVSVATAAVPTYEVPQTDAPGVDDIPALASAVFEMRALAAAEAGDLPAMLEPLVEAYEAWIAQQRERPGDPSARLRGFEHEAEAALGECTDAAERMRAGIAALADPVTAEAFRFANEAMWRQRLHTSAAERRRDGEESLDEALAAVEGHRHAWRPFQLGFILLNLPGISQLDHPERSAVPDGDALVDLLWFPTGGGKTEAYLGLTAFTLALRRLQGEVAGHDGSEGVGVLMRYTLRLLTLQQFQRATALICAMEVIRGERIESGDLRWGRSPFRIGLWVGQRSTPNRTEDAEAWVNARRGGKQYQGGGASSPAQLARCPWCGEEIDPGKHLRVDKARWRTLTYCGDSLGRCEFSRKRRPDEGIPVVVVDEEVYRLLPGLVIATVDKFAQMPWKGQVQTLFGRVDGRCERHGFRWPVHPDEKAPRWEAGSHLARDGQPAAKTVPAGPLRPPDLIVQDELHLISGPLGSLVGLYETAVDRLCTWEAGHGRVRPKVIASTATIRRAPYQVGQLFWRGVSVFPPPGLDARDSFFALQRDLPGDGTKFPGRRYVGICAPGRRLKNVLIRVYVAQMSAAQYLMDRQEAGSDAYMTLVGYFNALRELGGMRRLVEDDVATRLGKMDERGLARRPRPELEELTSRRSAEQIPRILDRLSVPHPRPEKGGGEWPLDVLLATNMISVGVDVPRLGVMVCAGQPKSTSEYIQATSRIGRATPGIVLTVYNWARPRDLSHYESFEHYHATFYSQVEALSVTPFATRAIDRGLTGVLASLLRLDGLEWSPNLGAEEVERTSARAVAAGEAIVERAAALRSDTAAAQLVEKTIKSRLDRWEKETKVAGRRLGYSVSKDGTTYGLLRKAEDGRWGDWTAPNSLREVEPGVRLILDPNAAAEDAPPWQFDPDADPGAEE